MNKENIDEKKIVGLKPNLQTFFNDTIFIYTFLSVITYSILFYIVSTPSIFQKIYFLSSEKSDLLRNLTLSGAIEPIIVLLAWTLFYIMTNKNKQNLTNKKIKFSLSYSFFILPITFFAFYFRSNNSFLDICNMSLVFSVHRFVAVFLFLTIVNVFFECIYIFYKKLFKIK